MKKLKNVFMIAIIVITTTLIVISFSSVMLFSQENKTKSINWIYDYNEAIKKANETNKNLFVFINSSLRSEIGERMERDVMSQNFIVNSVNKNYIALKILDIVDETPNLDFEKFDISGYPAIILLDKKGNTIDQLIGYVDQSYLYDFINQSEKMAVEEALKNEKEFIKDRNITGIQWIYEYDRAVEISKDTNKPILLVITAPSWSEPSQRLETDVFSDKSFSKFISDTFVPVKLFDTVDGIPNSELDRFDFPGYPSMITIDEKTGKSNLIVGYNKKDVLKSVLKDNSKSIRGDFTSKYTNDVEKRLCIDGEFAIDWVKNLYKNGNFRKCAEVSSMIFIKGDREALEPYMEKICFLMIASYVNIKKYDNALAVSEYYIENYNDGYYNEYVQYLMILILFKHYDISSSSEIVENFILKYPDSIFIDKLQDMFSEELTIPQT